MLEVDRKLIPIFTPALAKNGGACMGKSYSAYMQNSFLPLGILYINCYACDDTALVVRTWQQLLTATWYYGSVSMNLT